MSTLNDLLSVCQAEQESLLAGLMAIEPVRAAVLCG